MHPPIIIETVRSLWTWLWGRYHVPQNVFLVLLYFTLYVVHVLCCFMHNKTEYLTDSCHFVVGRSEIENEDGSDVIYEYDFPEDVGPLDRKSATSRDFSRRRSRFRRQASDYSAGGDYQYGDESMTSSTTSRAPSGVRHRNNGSDVSSERQMSLPTDPEV